MTQPVNDNYVPIPDQLKEYYSSIGYDTTERYIKIRNEYLAAMLGLKK